MEIKLDSEREDVSARTRAIVEDQLNAQWENLLSKWDRLSTGSEAPTISTQDVRVIDHLITDLGKAIGAAQQAHRDQIAVQSALVASNERLYEQLYKAACETNLDYAEELATHGGCFPTPIMVGHYVPPTGKIGMPRVVRTEHRVVEEVYVDRIDLVCRVVFERGRAPIVEQRGERTVLGDHNWHKIADAGHEALAISIAIAHRLGDKLLEDGTKTAIDAAARLGQFYGGASPSPMNGTEPVTPSVHSIHKPGA